MQTEMRNEWIINNTKFIYKVCDKYRYRYDFEDCVQTAFLGAIAALDRADAQMGNKAIRGYVSQYIDGYILNYCIKKDCPITIPRYYRDKGVRLSILSIEWEYESEESFESLYLPYEERGYEEVEVMEDFRRCIKNLPEKVRKTALMIAEGYERKDVAEADGCSKQNINLRVDSIKRACRRLYA